MNAGQKIKVLLVDDSPLVLSVLQRFLNQSAAVEVVGTARNGREALESIPVLDPQVICCDLHMPIMDGLEFTRQVMARFPRPILMVSDYVHEGEKANIFAAIEAGAVDVLPKPRAGFLSDNGAAKELVDKVRVLSGVRSIARRPVAQVPKRGADPIADYPLKLVAIGSSTGGPRALRTILGALDADFPVPILCVQHISIGFTPGMVSWLQRNCALHIEIAQADQHPEAGRVYFAAEKCHLVVDAQRRLQYSDDPPLNGHRPAVDMLFRSLAQHGPHGTLGLVLTGMGQDGATGMLQLAHAGGITVAQDEDSCEVFGMPRKAIELGAAQHTWPLSEMASRINALCKGNRAT